MEVDKILCSKDCPCKNDSYNYYMYKSDPLSYDIYKKYDVSGVERNFQDCKNTLENQNINEKIKVNKKFANYWKNIEKRFNCVGFCQTSYYSDELNANIPFAKYLFSDFLRGPVKHKGCFRLLMNWIIKALISFGSLGLGSSIIQILIVFAGLNMLKEEDVKNEDIIEGNKIEEEKKNESNEQKNN